MDIKELIKTGRLSEARRQLVEAVKAAPSNLSYRTLLFQVLSFLGEWDKAERHLQAIAAQNEKSETGVQVYKNLISAEKERSQVYKSERRPAFLPETPAYIEIYFTARKKLIEGKSDEAGELFGQLESQRPVISGSIAGKDFTGLQDTDTLLSPFLEAIVHERYVWIPIEYIRELSIPPPKTLLDLLWIQANITTWEGMVINCYLPVLYPDSFRHEDEQVKLGRLTDWVSLGGPFIRGMGQHVFQLGEEEKALLEIREISFNIPGS